MSDNILDIKNLSVQYETDDGLIKAVNDVSLSVIKGETLGLVGETGAGKTTVALSIMGLIQSPPGKIVSGEIIFNGENLLEKDEKNMRAVRGALISMIFQDPMTALNPIMKVEDQIAEVIFIHQGVSKSESIKKARETLEMVGIPAERGGEYPHQFSGGMKQRVVIAMALACSTQLLIADEPTTALDVTIQAQVLKMMTELRGRLNSAMLIITHDLGVVAETCDSVAVMYAGQIVEYGAIEKIFDFTSHPYTEGLFGSLPSLDKDVHRLRPIEGLMADPANLPVGCNFSPRCSYCTEECLKAKSELIEIAEDHLVRCFKCKQEGWLKNGQRAAES